MAIRRQGRTTVRTAATRTPLSRLIPKLVAVRARDLTCGEPLLPALTIANGFRPTRSGFDTNASADPLAPCRVGRRRDRARPGSAGQHLRPGAGAGGCR